MLIMRFTSLLRIVFAGILLLSVQMFVYADDEETGVQLAKSDVNHDAPLSQAAAANAVISEVTGRLLKLIAEATEYVDEDEARFYRELGAALKDYVDFPSFSRAVMGRYASRSAMESLDETAKEKLQQQIERFNGVFSSALINTYGKGLLVFEGEKIEVVAPTPEAEERAAAGRATVKQLIYGERETPFEIYYSLRKNGNGEWKIRNLIVESSNLGKIYRNQFSNAYKVYEGDIDKIIDNWIVTEG